MKVDWVLSGDRTRASSRLQGYAIHDWMTRRGIDSRIIAANFAEERVWSLGFVRTALRACRSRADVVVLEGGFEWSLVQLARLCSSWGKRVVAVCCDLRPGDYDACFDVTIVPTRGLAEKLGIRRFVVIDDIVEVPAEAVKRSYGAGAKPRVVWVGHGRYAAYITPFIDRLRREVGDRFDFELISLGSFATKQWAEETVVSNVLACDIAIIPIPTGEWFENKSTNRLAMMFSLGMPTVASPIASYLGLGRDGENVLFASSPEQFAQRLLEFLPEERRRALGSEARRSVGDRYRIERIGPEWLSALESVKRVPRSVGKIAAIGLAIRVAAWGPG